jgi:hypothetical protein
LTESRAGKNTGTNNLQSHGSLSLAQLNLTHDNVLYHA